ncbi:phage major capsid protein [Dietzia sp. B19]|uniref:phage major capsid protein n=1 Tax=Dietzia sp. B19 TaxID=1630632 RepID=UPI0015FCC683|nr:phage major capsid protein [Dietzia sp. B19]MBB1057854.1 phage major capsid protein [Dietzia sp. B19]
MNLKEERDALVKASLDLIAAAEKRGGLSDADRADLKAKEKHIRGMNEHLEKAAEDQALLAQLKGSGGDSFVPDHSGGGKGGGLPVGDGAPLAIAPAAVKATARELAGNLVTAGPGGQKALIAGGTATATILARDTIGMPQLPTSILSLIPTAPLDSPTYRYLRQTNRAMNAGAVAPGEVKPTSAIGLTPVEDRLRVVAHVSDGMNKYDLLDVRNLQRFVENEFRWGLMTKVEQLILTGDGEGENPTGLLMQSGIQTQEFTDDLLTTVRKAITAVEVLGYTPNVIAMTPGDWEAVELTKATGTGAFVLEASPVDRAARKLFGIQVVVSTALEPGTAIVADLTEVALYTDRRGVMAEWNGQGQSDFESNLFRLRVEGRFGLGVGQPQAVVQVDTAA